MRAALSAYESLQNARDAMAYVTILVPNIAPNAGKNEFAAKRKSGLNSGASFSSVMDTDAHIVARASN
jgi:hypothetical protein